MLIKEMGRRGYGNSAYSPLHFSIKLKVLLKKKKKSIYIFKYTSKKKNSLKKITVKVGYRDSRHGQELLQSKSPQPAVI